MNELTSLLGRRIPSPRRHLFDRPAHPIAAPPSLRSAGTSHCRAAILISASASSHRPINFWRAHPQSPCPNPLFQPAHPIAVPPSPISAGASHRLFRPAHPIVVPPSLILAGASPCRTANPISAGASHRRTTISYLGPHVHSMLRRAVPDPSNKRRTSP